MEEENNKELVIERDIYGSFSLHDSEFAISVKAIQEVVNEPDHYHAIPLAPDFLLGIFNLRGMIVPVVDLRKILKFSEKEAENSLKERKIAIIEHGDLCVGVLFDSTGEVFNGNEVEKNQFGNSGGRSQKDRVVEGVFKMDDGNRLIQILNPYELLKLDKLPQTDEIGKVDSIRNKKGKKSQCISFLVGGALCAININSIQEIVKVDKVENAALSSDKCLGAVNVRGNTIPIVDFSSILGYQGYTKEEFPKNGKIIIMRLADELFGLLVDSVESIVSYFEEDVIRFPILAHHKKNMFLGCISSSDEVETILLDHKKILSNSEIESITHGHSKLYKEISEEVKDEKKVDVHRSTYITFSIGYNYAFQISEVREVINLPEDILVPPNLARHYKGMINLRGELVPIIDPRKLYGMNESEASKKPKILILRFEDSSYGLMVDSVNSIISFHDNEKINLPEMMYKNSEGFMSEDIKEAIQVDNDEGPNKTLLVLNLKAISARASSRTAA